MAKGSLWSLPSNVMGLSAGPSLSLLLGFATSPDSLPSRPFQEPECYPTPTRCTASKAKWQLPSPPRFSLGRSYHIRCCWFVLRGPFLHRPLLWTVAWSRFGFWEISSLRTFPDLWLLGAIFQIPQNHVTVWRCDPDPLARLFQRLKEDMYIYLVYFYMYFLNR